MGYPVRLSFKSKSSVVRTIVLVLLCFWQGRANAGALVSPSVRWGAYAFRPVDQESTPNYFGVGGGLRVGYSIGQTVDLSLFYDYMPGKLEHSATPFEHTSALSFGGFELGLRILESLFLAGRVGRMDFHLFERTDPNEVGGHWAGLGAGGSVGGIVKVGASRFWQVSLDANSGTSLNDVDESALGSSGERKVRQMDNFCLSVAYVFNHFYNSSVDNSSVGSFLKSLSW